MDDEPHNAPSGPEWRWIAGGGITVIGLLVAVIFSLLMSRLGNVEQQVEILKTQVNAIPVMDVKLTVANDSLREIKAQLGKLVDGATGEAAVRDDRDRKDGKR
jgi:hypothetical protein